MNVHEYQAKDVLREFGVAVPEGHLATTPAEAEAAAKKLGTPVVVVKAQVHAGGRGKGGGVKVVKSPGDAKTAASVSTAYPSPWLTGFLTGFEIAQAALQFGFACTWGYLYWKLLGLWIEGA